MPTNPEEIENNCVCHPQDSNAIDKPHFFILDNGPVASPSRCGICGYPGSDRKYLDPRLDFEFFGTLIFCEMCIGVMANDFGFLQPAQSRVIEHRLEEAERELVVLRQAVLHLENFHDAIGGLTSLVGSDDSPSPVITEPEVPEESVTGAIEDESINFDEFTVGDSTPDEPAGESGPDDLLNFAAANSLDF